jgi:hypothetical protein
MKASAKEPAIQIPRQMEREDTAVIIKVYRVEKVHR